MEILKYLLHWGNVIAAIFSIAWAIKDYKIERYYWGSFYAVFAFLNLMYVAKNIIMQ